MSKNTLILDEVFQDNFELIAIHCSLEAYRIAYFINKKIRLKLKRLSDLELFQNGSSASVPIYYFQDDVSQSKFYLTHNKIKLKDAITENSNLFAPSKGNVLNTTLLKEYKKADYLLKIEDDGSGQIPLKRLLIELNQIKHIITAYSINTETLKDKQRLVFL